MEGPNQSSHQTDSYEDRYDDSVLKRVRKNHSTLVARNRRTQVKSKKRRSGGSGNVVGITHRRNHRWSW